MMAGHTDKQSVLTYLAYVPEEETTYTQVSLGLISPQIITV